MKPLLRRSKMFVGCCIRTATAGMTEAQRVEYYRNKAREGMRRLRAKDRAKPKESVCACGNPAPKYGREPICESCKQLEHQAMIISERYHKSDQDQRNLSALLNKRAKRAALMFEPIITLGNNGIIIEGARTYAL